jgi:hypothetical protein
MLTIKNLNKLNNKTLGKKNFYVESIEETFTIDGHTYSASEHQYKITITNRIVAITITLNRDEWNTNTYKLESSTRSILYITLLDIRNMDIFIDKLKLFALG